MSYLTKVFNRYNKMVAIEGSELNYDVYRPNYTAANQTGSLVVSNISVRVDTRAQQFAEPALQGGMYFDIFLDRSIVQEGDIIIPTGLSPTASSYLQAITIAQISGLKPCVGVFTDCLGSITEDVNTVIYSNVRWMWGSAGQPKAAATSGINSGLFPFDRRKAILYRREGIGLPVPLQKDMKLVETIDGLQHWWRIVDIMSVGNYTTLQIEEDGD